MTAHGRVFVASGHGGDDPGAIADGIVERDLNAAVAARLSTRLAAHGVDVVSDLDHGNPAFPAEAALAHEVGGVKYYIAIHHNHVASDAPRGAEAFGSPGPGIALATALQCAQVDSLRTLDPDLPDRGVKDGAETGAAKHLTRAPGDVVVVEPCFLSSPADRAIATDPRYADLLAEAWCRAIIDHGRVDGTWSTSFEPAGPSLPPVFSVILPTCDRPLFLAEAIDSILSQTLTGLEVIVIDDGLTHPVADFDDERVRVIRPGGGRGPAAARNSGIDAARGRYLAFLDDDDKWTPRRLDLAIKGLRRAPVAVCWTQHLGGPLGGRRRVLEGRLGDRLLEDTTPCLGATAVERSVAPRFEERWMAIEDVVWWWTLAKQASVSTVEEVGYLVRLHDGDRGRNANRVRVAENLQLLAEQRQFFSTHRRSAAHRWRRVSLLAREDGQYITSARAAIWHVALSRRIPGPIRRPLSRAVRHVRRTRQR